MLTELEKLEVKLMGLGLVSYETDEEGKYSAFLCADEDLPKYSKYKIYANEAEESLQGKGETEVEAIMDLANTVERIVSDNKNISLASYSKDSNNDNILDYYVIYYVYYSEYEQTYKKVGIRKVSRDGTEKDPDNQFNLYWTVSELIQDNLVYVYSIKKEELCTEYFSQVKIEHEHCHSFEEVLEAVIKEPYAIWFSEEDKDCYSNQELRIIEELQKYMKLTFSKQELKECKNIEKILEQRVEELING